MSTDSTLPVGEARKIIDLTPSGIIVTNHEAVVTYCNPWFANTAGREVSALVGHRLASVLDVPGRIYFDTHVLPMIYIQGYAREIMCRIAMADGSTVPVLLNANLDPGDAKGRERIIFTMIDATERAIYESELRRARDGAEELAAIIRSSRVAVFRIDADGRIKRWNAASAAIFGFDEATASGSFVWELMTMASGPDWLTRRLAAASAAKTHDATFFEDVTESGRYLSISIAPIADVKDVGGPPDYSLVMRDVTDRVVAEKRLKIMMRELKHRVKNNLAVVNGIARQTFRSPGSKEDAARFFSRIQALSAAHDLLVENDWDATSLLQVAQMTALKSGFEDSFDIDGPDIQLPAQSVAMLSLAFFELMTNAIKYGALKNGGKVALHWEILRDADAPAQFILRWDETATSLVDTPAKKGFGSRLIETLVAAELNGTAVLSFAPEGLKYRLQAPYWQG